jgi:hypothetical protein
VDRTLRRGAFAGGTAPGPSGGTLTIAYRLAANGNNFGSAVNAGGPPVDTWLFERGNNKDVNACENFQPAMLCEDLTKYDRWVSSDPDIDTVIVNWANWLIATQYGTNSAGRRTFRYCNVTVFETGNNAGTHFDTLNLNGMFLGPLTHAWGITGDPAVQQVIRDLVAGMLLTPNNGTDGPFLKSAVPPVVSSVEEKVFDEYAKTLLKCLGAL